MRAKRKRKDSEEEADFLPEVSTTPVLCTCVSLPDSEPDHYNLSDSDNKVI